MLDLVIIHNFQNYWIFHGYGQLLSPPRSLLAHWNGWEDHEVFLASLQDFLLIYSLAYLSSICLCFEECWDSSSHLVQSILYLDEHTLFLECAYSILGDSPDRSYLGKLIAHFIRLHWNIIWNHYLFHNFQLLYSEVSIRS